ncbi:MAG: MG2 domain-containing protein [Myxococcota bacterium]
MHLLRNASRLAPLASALVVSLAACSPAGSDTVVQPPDITTDHAVFDEKSMALTLDSGGALALTMPIGNEGDRSVDGEYTLTLRDLGGNAIDRTSGEFTATPGGIAVPVRLTGLPADTTGADLATYIIDYKVAWAGGGRAEGTRSAFDALQKLAVTIMTEDAIELGKAQHVSLFVLDPATAKPIPDAQIDLVMTGADGKKTSTRVTTDAAGQAHGDVPAPSGEGDATLSVTVVGGGVHESDELPVRIVRSQKVLLTTDKPLYQPGQTLHLRALALRSGDKTPEADQALVFEVEDGKGNILARESVQTDAFGIAATQLAIANQVNLGTWKVRATLGTTVSEKTITVDRYVLPKFKVTADLDHTWYRPSATVQVTGDARYFFGKAVSGGAVTITGSTFDVDFTAFATAQATTDADGHFSATLTVPAHVVGLPLDQGKGLLKIDVAVVDGAGHSQSVSRTASVAEGAVDVALVPESGKLVAGLENTVFVVTTDPDGGPVQASVELLQGGEVVAHVATDAQGLGALTVVPTVDASGKGVTTFQARVTGGGETVTVDKTLAVGADTETVLLRSDKAVYHTGDTAQIEVLVADDSDRVWLDVVHGGQTAMLEALTVEHGAAHYAFDLDGTLGGEVLVSAYTMTDKGALVRDQRLLYVQPDDELAVTMTPRAASYRPGEKATVDVSVKDDAGRGVAAAVGVQVVDEAVFALQETQPGLLKVFFDLARELSAPMISPACSGCDAVSIIRGDEQATPTYDEKARVAFAALSDMPLHGIDKNTFTAEMAAVTTVLKPHFDAEKTRVQAELDDLVKNGEVTFENVGAAMAREDVAGVDFWNRPYSVVVDTAAQTGTFVSSGPDERVGTADDLSFSLGFNEAIYHGRGWGWGGEGDFDGMEPGAAGGEGNGGVPMDPGTTDDGGKDEGGTAVKVRQDFPETLYVNPALITDGDGKASIDIDLADSITTWRMTGLASAKNGLLGSGTGGLVVFQDFFADVDFPVAMTRGDVLRVPVALYNYLAVAQTVKVDLEAAPWFEALHGTSQSVTLQPNEVRAVSFDIRALAVGTQGLTVLAHGTSSDDAVRRTVTVRPDGKPIDTTLSARFAVDPQGGSAHETVTRSVSIPADNIDGSQSLLVKVYPGYMSQVVDGIDSLLRLPGGCFEQTTSTAWPNVLVMDYLGKTGALSPELEIKAREYVSEGYQRLLTFECASGGFNWWEGDDPGNAVLSAVGIMMFTDTKNVAFVDDGVIDRAAKYLTATQQSDGSWTEERHLHAGNENLGAGSVRATAYIAWALQHAQREPATVQKALGHLRSGVSASDDIYTKALVANALAMNDRGDSKLQGLLQDIHASAIVEGDKVHWSPEEATMVGGYNDSGDIETTAVVALALMQAQAFTPDVQGALTWLLSKKDAQGNWGYSTQATVLTLKALLASLSAGSPTTDATISVKLDGQLVAERHFDAFNADVLWQVDLSEQLAEGDHEVTLDYTGTGNLMWQVSGQHWLPWSAVPADPPSPLSIDVEYDKTHLTTDDVINVTVTVSNSDPDTTGMMMAEVGLPPGFDLDTTALDALLGKGQVARYDKTALRLVVYLEPIAPNAPATFGYALRARYPLEATAPESETYLYYDKSVRAGSGPVGLVVE